MLSIEDALQTILSRTVNTRNTEVIPLSTALGRITATDYVSTIDVPPTDNSAMDGYAINTVDIHSQSTLPISQIITAGQVPQPLAPKTAARIFTGALIPQGANAIVMQEECSATDHHVTLPTHIPAGNNIRSRGQDIRVGKQILNRGQRLHPQEIALLASIGVQEVTVYQKPTVAILSTGDELTEPGQPLTAGKIYNSNRYLLLSFLQQLGLAVVDLGTIDDNLPATVNALQRAAQQADCIISTGGVSVGNEDHVKPAVEQLGSLDIWRIALKPGKPLAFGHINNIPFFGLPGNPVSVFVTFLLFVRPFLLAQQGMMNSPLPTLTLTANFSLKPNPQRQEYLRITIDGEYANKLDNQSSGVITSLVNADGLAIIPPATAIAPGQTITVIPFNMSIYS